ncbi:hypothetical protein ABZ297_31195 [Nonomuraea sp. NPDC005983]|uniref:hypothetical protein n=1 Tax=Nonomuraea sp. NPDC005983 TaxID=3155595 RepID=UPI0033BB33B8
MLDDLDEDLAGALRVARGAQGPAYAFKKVVLGEVASVTTVLRERLGIAERQAQDVISTATSMAGALWQMAAPGTRLRALYETRPELAHALVDVESQLTRILTALLKGMCAGQRPDASGHSR